MSALPIFTLLNKKAVKKPRPARDLAFEMRQNINLLTKALSSKGLSENKEILVPLCGDGQILRVLAEREAKLVVGTESTGKYAKAHSLLRKENPTLPILILEDEATSLPYPDDTFDVVVFDRTLEYRTDAQAILAEACRLLRTGGRLIVLADMKHAPNGCGTELISLKWANLLFSEKTRTDYIKKRTSRMQNGETIRRALLETTETGACRLRTEPRMTRKDLTELLSSLPDLKRIKSIPVPAQGFAKFSCSLPGIKNLTTQRLLLVFEKPLPDAKK